MVEGGLGGEAEEGRRARWGRSKWALLPATRPAATWGAAETRGPAAQGRHPARGVAAPPGRAGLPGRGFPGPRHLPCFHSTSRRLHAAPWTPARSQHLPRGARMPSWFGAAPTRAAGSRRRLPSAPQGCDPASRRRASRPATRTPPAAASPPSRSRLLARGCESRWGKRFASIPGGSRPRSSPKENVSPQPWEVNTEYERHCADVRTEAGTQGPRRPRSAAAPRGCLGLYCGSWSPCPWLVPSNVFFPTH